MIASFVAVRSVIAAFVAVTVEAVELLPCKVNVTVPVAAKVAVAFVIAVALILVSLEIKLIAFAVSLAFAPASTPAVFVPKKPLKT